MITADEREKGFREALAALLERHGAEMQITDDGEPWGTQKGEVIIRMPSRYDDDVLIADYAEFRL